MFKRYELSEDKLIKITRLCVQEQGTITGVKAEASLAANLLETNKYYQQKYGDDIYSFMRYSKWFSKAEKWMDEGSASALAIEAVRDVLVNGNRTLPQHIDEHDCMGDILYITNHGAICNKQARGNYIRDVTVIKNVYGSKYTFYCFPDKHSDPFGYTRKPKDDDFVFVKVGD